MRYLKALGRLLLVLLLVVAIMSAFEYLAPAWLQVVAFVGLVAFLVWSEVNT